MAWSYRQDRADSFYATTPGPHLVDGDQSEDPAPGPPGGLREYGADGPIDESKSHTAMLTKPTAGAYTLGLTKKDGIRLIITNGSSAAHVVTATGLLQNGVTGGAKNQWTAAAFPGSSISLVSYGGKWNVIALQTGVIA